MGYTSYGYLMGRSEYSDLKGIDLYKIKDDPKYSGMELVEDVSPDSEKIGALMRATVGDLRWHFRQQYATHAAIDKILDKPNPRLFILYEPKPKRPKRIGYCLTHEESLSTIFAESTNSADKTIDTRVERKLQKLKLTQASDSQIIRIEQFALSREARELFSGAGYYFLARMLSVAFDEEKKSLLYLTSRSTNGYKARRLYDGNGMTVVSEIEKPDEIERTPVEISDTYEQIISRSQTSIPNHIIN